MRPSFRETGSHILAFVEADQEQSLADEPGIHGAPPSGVDLVANSVRHVSYCSPELLTEQVENLDSRRFTQTQAVALVWENVTRCCLAGILFAID
jgi:hypothetical protein